MQLQPIPTLRAVVHIIFIFSGWDLSSGSTLQKGSAQGSEQINPFFANGEYVITDFSIYDKQGMVTTFGVPGADLDSFVAENNIQASFVVQGATEDTISPLVSILIDSNTYDKSQLVEFYWRNSEFFRRCIRI